MKLFSRHEQLRNYNVQCISIIYLLNKITRICGSFYAIHKSASYFPYFLVQSISFFLTYVMHRVLHDINTNIPSELTLPTLQPHAGRLLG